MDEYKRIFLAPRRAALILVICAACLAAFVINYLGGITPNAVKNASEAVDFYLQVIDECEKLPAASAAEKIDLTLDELNDISSYINKSIAVSYSSEEEFLSALKKYPYLESLYLDESKSVNDFNRAKNALTDRLKMLYDDAENIAGYEDYLKSVQEQASVLSNVGIFNSSGFSKKNLEKTASDFAALDGVEPSLGNSCAVECWADFKISDYAFLICMAVIALSFVDERKKGLHSIVRSCPNGRLGLGVTRISALFVGSIFLTLLLYALPLVVSAVLSGGFGELDRPVQSMAMFSKCTLRLSISQWICVHLIERVICGALIGLAVWCIAGVITGAQFALGIAVAVFAIEYLLYTLIPVQSAFNILKYLNIFSYVHSLELYTYYLNINIFGAAVGIGQLAVVGLVTLTVALSAADILIQCKKYPSGNKNLLLSISDVLNRALDAVRRRLTIFGWEAYKAFVLEYGALLIVAAVVICGSLTYYMPTGDMDIWYQNYLDDAAGQVYLSPDGNSLDEYIEKARADAKGQTNYSELSGALDMLKIKSDDIVKRAEDGGYELWLVDEQMYSAFYGESSVDAQRTNAAAAVIFAAICCAGIVSYERLAGTAAVVRSTRRGRASTFAAKAGVAVLMGALIWAAVYIREFLTFLSLHGAEDFAAPVQNISALSEFPFAISIGGYLAILYLARLVMLAAVSLVVMCVGGLFNGMLSSCAACVGIFGLPAFLTLSGVPAAKYVSPITAVSSAEILWNMGGSAHLTAYWAVLIAAAVIGLLLFARYRVKS